MNRGSFEINYSARQEEANLAEEQFVLYGGAKGGGKSWWLCSWAFEQAVSYPGNRGFLGRKRGVDFNNTTLETWKKCIPPSYYKISEQKKRITIPAFNSYIDYGGLDSEEDVQKFNSAEYGFIGVDQAEEISRDAFSMLRGTLRHKLPDGQEPSYRVRLTANPAQCWLKEQFITKKMPGHRFIKALPSDNPFLASGYIQNLEEAFQHRPELLKAYLHGSWDELAAGDLVVNPEWVNKSIMLTQPEQAIKRIVICDPAHFGDDETVIYVMELTSSGYYRVTDQEFLTHKTTMDTAGRLIAKRKEHAATAIALDNIGIGTGIADRLSELEEDVILITSSRKPTTTSAQERYFNLRAQFWFEGARKIFEAKAEIPKDELLRNQLSSVRYEFMSNGRLKIESKQDIKARQGSSTDRPDAYLMGLHALDIAERLDEEELLESQTDRAGRGEPVSNDNEYLNSYEEF